MTKKRASKLHVTSRSSIFKLQRKPNGEKIRKMLVAMEAQANKSAGQPEGSTKGNPDSEQFFSTGRTGRRNALPDILGDHAHVTSSDLPARLQALTTSENVKLNLPENQPGPSRHATEQN